MVPTVKEVEEILGCPLGGRKLYLLLSAIVVHLIEYLVLINTFYFFVIIYYFTC